MIQVVFAGIGLLVSLVGLVSGLIGAYVSLQNRALLAEVRAELAETENRVVLRINGNYVRTAECLARKETTQAKIDSLTQELHGLMRGQRLASGGNITRSDVP